jgi:starch-binding outer membrane protein, SusD/RagB family
MTIRNRALVAAGAVLLAACTESVVPDYNNSTESEFTVVRTQAQLQQLAIGILDVDRQTHDFQILFDETIARDVFRIDGSEPRYVNQPLGATSMSSTIFVGQAVFNGPYRAIRSATNLIDAVDAAGGTLAGGVEFSDADKAVTKGFARTIKALQYMRLIEQRDTLGVAIYTSPTELNPIQCKENGLAYAAALLDSADTELQTAGGEFLFDFPSGFAGFDTPAGFRKFERALKAKVAYYQAFDLFARTAGADPGASTGRTIDAAKIAEAEAALAASGFSLLATDSSGVFHTYSLASGDYSNPNFDPSKYRINSRVLREAEGTTITVTGSDTTFNVVDRRLLNKVVVDYDKTDCVAIADVSSCLVDNVNSSLTDPLPLLRNDELALIKAQLLWGRAQYQAALDIVNAFRRTQGGFTTDLTLAGDFGGATTTAQQDQLMLAILREKRNQLLFESASRFVDYRMFGYLSKLGKERGNDPIPVFPFPSAEVLARGGNTDQVCD